MRPRRFRGAAILLVIGRGAVLIGMSEHCYATRASEFTAQALFKHRQAGASLPLNCQTSLLYAP
ncbi:hypothetical protein KCP78_22855 [Salmonella enterica subsp. enterica]|nr:hypothetical protein KCP78_22855 [Salmonella enterica subsp. enterica]